MSRRGQQKQDLSGHQLLNAARKFQSTHALTHHRAVLSVEKTNYSSKSNYMLVIVLADYSITAPDDHTVTVPDDHTVTALDDHMPSQRRTTTLSQD